MFSRILKSQFAADIVRSPSMWQAAAQSVVSRILKKKVVTVSREGFTIRAGTERGQGLWCAIAGSSYEPELTWLIDFLRPGDRFIDIGANIGIYSLHAGRKVGASGQVLSLEPGEGAFQMLSHNLLTNHLSWVKPLPFAASDAPGKMSFGGDTSTWNSMSLTTGTEGDTQVEVTTLDKLCKEFDFSAVTAIKIDAEGVEHAVLRGGQNIIQRDKPAIIFERIFQSEANSPAQLLQDWGYRLHELPPKDGHRSPNLIAVHPENPRSPKFA